MWTQVSKNKKPKEKYNGREEREDKGMSIHVIIMKCNIHYDCMIAAALSVVSSNYTGNNTLCDLQVSVLSLFHITQDFILTRKKPLKK